MRYGSCPESRDFLDSFVFSWTITVKGCLRTSLATIALKEASQDDLLDDSF